MAALRDFTNARVGLGRAGDSIPSSRLLEFRLAHARARDAVHLEMDTLSLAHEFKLRGWDSVVVESKAADRHQYLLRPDLGRTLSDSSRADLESLQLRLPLVFCVADGLSAAAVHRHAEPLLDQLGPSSPIILVRQGRVAIGDEIGELAGAELCLLLIGERPGLSSPASLGAYLTYDPRRGRHDGERNCVSNIHDEGLSYQEAAQKIRFLIQAARALKLSGVELKERAEALPGPSGQSRLMRLAT